MREGGKVGGVCEGRREERMDGERGRESGRERESESNFTSLPAAPTVELVSVCTMHGYGIANVMCSLVCKTAHLPKCNQYLELI